MDGRSARGCLLMGRLVRDRREQLRLSQRQLERLSGVDQTVISRLENGRLTGIRWSRFMKLVDALGGLAPVDARPPMALRFMPPGAGPARTSYGEH